MIKFLFLLKKLLDYKENSGITSLENTFQTPLKRIKISETSFTSCQNTEKKNQKEASLYMVLPVFPKEKEM